MNNNFKSDLRAQFDEATSLFDLLPSGWVNSFVPRLRERLFNILGSYAEDFVLLDAKEKFGELRVHWAWRARDYSKSEFEYTIALQNDIDDVLFYYRHVSANTCISCGDKANHFSKKYDVPICEMCAKSKRK